jgi:hypothetical protein
MRGRVLELRMDMVSGVLKLVVNTISVVRMYRECVRTLRLCERVLGALWWGFTLIDSLR